MIELPEYIQERIRREVGVIKNAEGEVILYAVPSDLSALILGYRMKETEEYVREGDSYRRKSSS